MTEETTQNYCIVIKSGSGPMALVNHEGARQLPVVTLSSETWLPTEAAEVNGQLMDHHGLNCTMLRWLEHSGASNLLVMEWHPGSPEPEVDVEWVDPNLDNLALPREQMQMIRTWRQSSMNGLVQWENPGWMKDVVLRLLKLFDGVQLPQLTNLAQIKAGWGMSTLLLVETTEADHFFKAGTCQGIDEWRLMKLLHQKFPDHVPAPLVVNEQRGWMITRNIDNEPLAPLDYDSLGRAFQTYAAIQLGCTGLHNSSEAAGLRVRDASWLRSHVEAFFSADNVPAEFSGLKLQLDLQVLARLENTWRQNIDALEAAKLPLTLNQEDLHFENILHTDDGPVLIDWADCAMAHPFFSFHRILSLWGVEISENDRLEREHVRQAYLDAFRHLGDDDQLQREIEITDRLRSLYHAFRWRETIQGHHSGSCWYRRCRENAIQQMTVAIQQASG